MKVDSPVSRQSGRIGIAIGSGLRQSREKAGIAIAIIDADSDSDSDSETMRHTRLHMSRSRVL